MKLTKHRTERGTIEQMRREMDRFFDDMIPFSWLRENDEPILRSWTPTSDLAENEKEYKLTMDLPGMEKGDIKVNVQDNRITISGERKSEEKEEKKDYIRRERRHGSFYRSFTLPEGIKEEEIKANFKGGVLNVVIPKSEVAKPKSVKVE